MKQLPEDEARQRSARARQVISGSDIRPPAPYSPRTVTYEEESHLGRPQWIYLAILLGLLALGIILYLFFGFDVASIIFFLLALALLAGWLVF